MVYKRTGRILASKPFALPHSSDVCRLIGRESPATTKVADEMRSAMPKSNQPKRPVGRPPSCVMPPWHRCGTGRDRQGVPEAATEGTVVGQELQRVDQMKMTVPNRVLFGLCSILTVWSFGAPSGFKLHSIACFTNTTHPRGSASIRIYPKSLITSL